MKKRIEQWFQFAKIDIESAEVLNEKDRLTQAAAFHCQQAVEKILKGAIESFDKTVPRIHDLIRLLNIVKNETDIEIDSKMLKQINEVYIDARYPSDVGLIPKGIPDTATIGNFLVFLKALYEEMWSIVKNAAT